jgi:hypothetical protein
MLLAEDAERASPERRIERTVLCGVSTSTLKFVRAMKGSTLLCVEVIRTFGLIWPPKAPGAEFLRFSSK